MRLRSPKPVARQALAAVLVAACAAVAGCGGGAAADPQAPVPADNRAATVRRGDFVAEQLLTGELRSAASELVIVPRLPSWETTIRFMVPDGSVVAEGERLVELDTAEIASELENRITQQQAALNELASKEAEIDGALAERELAVTQAEIALAKAEIEAAKPVDIQARKDYEAAQLALEQARVEHEKALADLAAYRESSRAEIDALRIELSKTEREVQQARQAIETMVLRAPASGIAVATENRREDRKYQEGDTVYVGATVMEIPDLNRMMVEADLSDVDDGQVVAGMTAACIMDAYPDLAYPCVVRSISPVAQEAGRRSLKRAFIARLDLQEVEPELMRPGMSVKVVVRTAERQDVSMAPRTALRFAEDGVFLATGDGERLVRLGPCNAAECVLEQEQPVETTEGGAP